MQYNQISNSLQLDFQQFDYLNVVEQGQNQIVIDNNGLLKVEEGNLNIETQQLFDKTQIETDPNNPQYKRMNGPIPQVLCKIDNTYTVDNDHEDYNVKFSKIIPSLMSPYNDFNETQPINNNTVLTYQSGNFLWQSLTDPFIISLNYSQISNNSSNYPSIISFNGQNIPTLINNVVGFIPNNSLSINQLYSPNSTSTKQFLSSYNSIISSEQINLSDIQGVSNILININSLTNPSNDSYIQIKQNGTVQYVQYPNIQFSNIINSSTGLILAQDNFANNLLYWLYINDQTGIPNENDILVFTNGMFKHVNQGVLQIDHSQVLGKLNLNQIEDVNNNTRHYFTSNSGQNQYENLTHLNQFIDLGYDNNKFLQSTSNGYQWATVSSISLNTLLTNLNTQTVVNQNQIASDNSGNLTFWKSQSGVNSYSMLLLSDINNINAVLLSINNLGYIPITYLASSGASADQYVLCSASNTQTWQLTSSLACNYNNLTNVPSTISGLNNLGFGSANQILCTNTTGNGYQWQTKYNTIMQNFSNLQGTGTPSDMNFVIYYSDNTVNKFNWSSAIMAINSQNAVGQAQVQTNTPAYQLFNQTFWGTSGQVLTTNGSNTLSWTNVPSLSGTNRIYYNNNSGILTGLTGTFSLPYFQSNGQLTTLPFSSNYAGCAQTLDRDGTQSTNYYNVSKIQKNNKKCFFDMYENDDAALYKSAFFQSSTIGANPAINNPDCSFLGGILATSAQSTLFWYTNSASQNNIFNGTVNLTLRNFLSSTTWNFVTSCSKETKDLIKHNDELGIKHDLCEKLLKTKLHIYTHKTDNISGRCKKNIEQRKRKYIGFFIEDLIQGDELFYHCVEHCEDLEKRGLFDKQTENEDGYKMKYAIDIQGVVFQLVNICREQAQRIIDLENENIKIKARLSLIEQRLGII